jgi:hypothetical protein
MAFLTNSDKERMKVELERRRAMPLEAHRNRFLKVFGFGLLMLLTIGPLFWEAANDASRRLRFEAAMLAAICFVGLVLAALLSYIRFSDWQDARRRSAV